MCGVFGIFGHPRAAERTLVALQNLQHRGQESAGIAITNAKGAMTCLRELGLVHEVFRNGAITPLLNGVSAIGHVRYSTAGGLGREEAQPFLVSTHRGQVAVAHNGNLTNIESIRSELKGLGAIMESTSDTEVVLHLLAKSKADNLFDAIVEQFPLLEGAYSMIFLTAKEMIVIRDPRGFRPLILGTLDGYWVVASESCAFDKIGATYDREVRPGEVLIITANGLRSLFPFPRQERINQCIFEHVYFARPNSQVFGQSVSQSRRRMGELLASCEFKGHKDDTKADIVVPVPDSGIHAALGYAKISGLELRFGLVRSHYIGRTFITPQQKDRIVGVDNKLDADKQEVAGQRVILVDDSIVRGNTSRMIVRKLREAGASEVHVRITCPPTVSPCFFGVDTPTEEELIASKMTVEEIRDFIEADSLKYLSMDRLRKACAENPDDPRFCDACYTRKYPVKIKAKSATA